jgi:glycosyl transferase family 87
VSSRITTPRAVANATALFLVATASAVLAFRTDSLGDYSHDAGPAIRALIDGDLAAFFANQPVMGSFSLLLRAPFALLSKLADGGELLVYRLGAFPCLVAAGLLGLLLARLVRRRGGSHLLCTLVAGACLVNPATFDALQFGHPEELLGAALCVSAVFVANRGRTFSAALLLGLALATKQWALIAVPVVVIAATGNRARLLLVTGLTAALFTVPMAVGNPGRFFEFKQAAGNTPSIVGPSNVWWPLVPVEERVIFAGTAAEKTVTVHTAPAWLQELTHPLIVLLPIPLSLLFWRRRHDPRAEDVLALLALLALLFLLRSMLDPVNNAYYHAPFLLSLLAFEAVGCRGLPVLGAVAFLGVWGSFHGAVPTLDHGLINAFYLAWTLPLALWLAIRVYAPGFLTSLVRERRLSQPLLSR